MSETNETEQSVLGALQEDAEDLGRARGRQQTMDRLHAPETATRAAQLAYEQATGKSWLNLGVRDQEKWRSSARQWIGIIGQSLAEASRVDDGSEDED